MFRFIHIADVHLDTHFYSKKPERRSQLREGIKKTFGGVIQCCIQEKVDALLIAGDLFDHSQLSFQTEQFLVNQFRLLNDHQIQVYYCTGNHDPSNELERINAIPWPPNVKIFKGDKIEVVTVMKGNEAVAKIIGVGHKNSRESRNLVANFPDKEGSLPHIGLIHTMVTNAKGLEAHDRYLPCTREDLIQKGYDYWALGHVHQYQQISHHSIYYSGNLQGRHPGETGEKGGLLVEIKDNQTPRISFRPFSAIRWETIEIEGLENVNHYQQLLEKINHYIQSQLDAWEISGEQLFLRVELQGRCPLKKALAVEENRQQLEEDLMDHWGLMDIEVKAHGLKRALSQEDFEEGHHVLSRALKLLKEAEENEEILKALSSLPFVNPNAGEGEEKRAYIRTLLKGLREEAMDRMAGDEFEN